MSARKRRLSPPSGPGRREFAGVVASALLVAAITQGCTAKGDPGGGHQGAADGELALLVNWHAQASRGNGFPGNEEASSLSMTASGYKRTIE